MNHPASAGPAPHHPPTAPSSAEEGPPRWPPARPRPSPRSLSEIVPARKCIFTAEDLAKYNASETFRSYISFLRFCGAAARGVSCKRPSVPLSRGGQALVSALEDLERVIEEVPPAPAALRYGNPAFREWHARAVALSPSLLTRVLTEGGKGTTTATAAGTATAAAEGTTVAEAATAAEATTPSSSTSLVEAEAKALAPFLSDSLGNASRIDYGTGHETLFATLLYCLAVAGALVESDAAAVVVVVFARYVRLCRRLQTTYWLEPAGSHGVWGLDDYCFLPFYWGAAQLDDKESGGGAGGSGGGGGGGGEAPASSSTAPIENDPTRDGAPSRPSGIRSDATLQEHGDAYLYLDAVRFVRTVKKGGPLSETSPMLCDIAATVPTWKRVNEGLLKMYRVEVCGKLPIMQHQLFGHLFPFPGRM